MKVFRARFPVAMLPLVLVPALLLTAGCDRGGNKPVVIATPAVTASPAESSDPKLTDDALQNLVRRSYQYVAMYNVNNKFAIKNGGWNLCDADTRLKDHTMREIARPNNDTLCIGCQVDLRVEPMVLKMPRLRFEVCLVDDHRLRSLC